MCPISGEQQHVIAQMVVEELLQETQVVIITAEVTAIFIFNLQVTKEVGEIRRAQRTNPSAFVCRQYLSICEMTGPDDCQKYFLHSILKTQRATQHQNLPSTTSHSTKVRKTKPPRQFWIIVMFQPVLGDRYFKCYINKIFPW